MTEAGALAGAPARPEGAASVLAYVGVGSNLGDPAAQVERALAGLARLGPLRSSHLYRSEPWGEPDQPWFVNAVAELAWGRSPERLFEELRALERAAGRTRGGARWGPRALDLDLLLFGDRRIERPGLAVPHPRYARRRFVLEPLAELAPDLLDPASGLPVRRLLADLDDPGRVEKMGRPGAVPGSAPPPAAPRAPGG